MRKFGDRSGWSDRTDTRRRVRRSGVGHRVSATLSFDPAGDLIGFVSDDRWQVAPPSPLNVPWSTPLSNYREVDGTRVATHGDANWLAPSGEWTYGRFDILALAYNVQR